MEEFEMEEIGSPEQETQMQKAPKRPRFLLVLCIFTFIGSGYSALYYLLMPFAKGMLPEAMNLYGDAFKKMGTEVVEQMNQVMTFMAGVPSWKYLLAGLCFVGSVVGAAFMLKLRKEGFHIYVVSQILSFAILSFLIGGLIKPQVGDIMWTVTFILLYYMQMRKAGVDLGMSKE